jgi:hypothetical protein
LNQIYHITLVNLPESRDGIALVELKKGSFQDFEGSEEHITKDEAGTEDICFCGTESAGGPGREDCFCRQLAKFVGRSIGYEWVCLK